MARSSPARRRWWRCCDVSAAPGPVWPRRWHSCPGLFMTDTNREWNEKRPEVIEAIVEGIPVGRAGEPWELGPLAVYLASPASAYMTGAALVMDGGYTLW